MPNANIFQVVIGENTYDIVDQGARELISALGNAVQWLGVTTTELVDNVTTSANVLINGETVTAEAGDMVQYDGEEFIYNGTTWQSIGKNNFGDLAFADSVSATYTPAGNVNVEQAADTKASITPFGSAGTLPTMTVENGVLTLNPGTLPTAGTPVDVVTAAGAVSATFAGTQATINSTASE